MLKASTIEIIQSTIPLLEEHGRTITDVFYEKLFSNHPFLKNIFNMANQGKGEQSRALSDAVVAYAKNIETVELLVPVVQRIAHKHVSLGIKKNHYAVVGENLLSAIQEVLNLPDNHEALTAWGEAYNVLADIFINAEDAIYNTRPDNWEGFRDFYIERIEEETAEVKSFYLKPVDLEGIPPFQGGQYIGIKVRPNESEFQQIRQYSLSKKGDFRITVKAENKGLVSNHLHRCNEGDVVSLQAPTGVFTLNKQCRKNIFIAGGVGITPLMSMLEEAIEEGANPKDSLFIQCAKDEESQIFRNDLDKLKTHQEFTHKLCYENSNNGDHQGYLNKEIIGQWLNDLDFDNTNAQVYFCGPKSFMAVLNQFFIELGFEEQHIHYEVFGPTTNL